MPDTLLDILLRANAARTGGDPSARAAMPKGAMPFVITCMDPRLVGRLAPALGLDETPPPKAQFAGGVVRPGDVAGLRSVLAAAIFNMATEVLIIGHTDCRMGKTSSSEIRSGLLRLGIPPDAFGGEEPGHWLGSFASERSSVQASVEALRAEPRMPAAMPIHGLLFHLDTGRLEKVIEGYAAAAAAASGAGQATVGGYRPGPATLDAAAGPVFGAPYVPQPTGVGPGTSSLEAPPQRTFGTPSPAPAFGAGPVSFGGGSTPGFPAPPPFAAPPPPSPTPVAPTPVAPPPPRPHREEPPEDEPPPPPRPKKRPAKPARPRGGDSPFDRAQEVLDRLKRDRDR